MKPLGTSTITGGTRLYLKHGAYAHTHIHLVVEPWSAFRMLDPWLRIVL
jgi:hypothetical protein